MKIYAEEKHQGGTFSPVYSEPYPGFLEERGFKVNPTRSHDLCDIGDYSSVTYPTNVGGYLPDEKAPLFLTPRVGFAREHYFDIPAGASLSFPSSRHSKSHNPEREIPCLSISDLEEMEASSEETEALTRSMFEEVKAAGGQACGAYLLNISSLGFSYTSALELTRAGQMTGLSLGKDLLGDVEQIYSTLNPKHIKTFQVASRKLLARLDQSFQANLVRLQSEADGHTYDLESLSGACHSEAERVAKQKIMAPILDWYPGFENAWEASGLKDSERRLAEKIEERLKGRSLTYHFEIGLKERMTSAIFDFYEETLR